MNLSIVLLELWFFTKSEGTQMCTHRHTEYLYNRDNNRHKDDRGSDTHPKCFLHVVWTRLCEGRAGHQRTERLQSQCNYKGGEGVKMIRVAERWQRVKQITSLGVGNEKGGLIEGPGCVELISSPGIMAENGNAGRYMNRVFMDFQKSCNKVDTVSNGTWGS